MIRVICPPYYKERSKIDLGNLFYKKQYKLYFLLHPLTMEIRYIGITSLSLKSRIYDHLRGRKDRNTYKDKWINSLLLKGIKAKAVLELICYSYKEVQDQEILYIEKYKKLGYRLVNTTIGGEGIIGHIPSEETRKKIGNAMRGKKHTEESRKKMSLAGKGKKFSKEHREKMSKSKTGKPGFFLGKKGNLHHSYGKKWSESQRESMKKHYTTFVFTEDRKKKHSERMKGENNPYYGKKHSDEVRAKMSLISRGKPKLKLRGRKISEEQKQKQIKTLKEYYKNNPVSEETRENLRIACSGKLNGFYGKKQSEETKAKIAETKRLNRLKKLEN